MDYSTSLLAVNITINTVIINSTIINIAVPDSNWNDSIYGISCQVVFLGGCRYFVSDGRRVFQCPANIIT